jgi:hypothetical protein
VREKWKVTEGKGWMARLQFGSALCYWEKDLPCSFALIEGRFFCRVGNMGAKALYVSGCTAKSLWQRYEIFDDRLELHTMLKNLVISFEHIEEVEVVPPILKSLRLHLLNYLPGIKLDLADFNEHVIVEKDTGIFRRVLFTPEMPEEFKVELERALVKFRTANPSLKPSSTRA